MVNESKLSKSYIWKEDALVLKDVCFECGVTKETGTIHYHHVVPIVKGGTRAIPLCDECHGKVHGAHMLKIQKLAAITRLETIRKRKEQGLHSGQGRPFGYKEPDEKFLSKPKNQLVMDLLVKGKTYDDIRKATGASPTTISKIIKIAGDRVNPANPFIKRRKCSEEMKENLREKHRIRKLNATIPQTSHQFF